MKNTSFFHTIYWNSNSNKNQHQNQYQIEPDAHTHTSTMGYKEQYIHWVKGFNLFLFDEKCYFDEHEKENMQSKFQYKICYWLKAKRDWSKWIETEKRRKRKREGVQPHYMLSSFVNKKILYQIHLENWTQRKNFILNWSPRLWTFAHGGVLWEQQEKSSFMCM